jgi:hypothetical protein
MSAMSFVCCAVRPTLTAAHDEHMGLGQPVVVLRHRAP